MNSEFSIKTTQLKKWADIAKFCHFWDMLGVPWEPSNLRAMFDRREARVVLMHIGGELRGTTAFWEGGNLANTHFLAFVGIDATIRRQGFGRILVEYTLGHKNTAWELDARNDNIPALNLYESIGFSISRYGEPFSRLRLALHSWQRE